MSEPRTLLSGQDIPGVETPGTFPGRSHHEQPLVEPQLGQAWQLPLRIICTPQVMHIGASWLDDAGSGTPAVSGTSSRVEADGIEIGSGSTSWPCTCLLYTSPSPRD